MSSSWPSRRSRATSQGFATSSADLEGAALAVGLEEADGLDGRGFEWGRWGRDVGPEHLAGLDLVGVGVAGPAAGEEEHREAVGDVAVGVGDRVEGGLGEGGGGGRGGGGGVA